MRLTINDLNRIATALKLCKEDSFIRIVGGTSTSVRVFRAGRALEHKWVVQVREHTRCGEWVRTFDSMEELEEAMDGR